MDSIYHAKENKTRICGIADQAGKQQARKATAPGLGSEATSAPSLVDLSRCPTSALVRTRLRVPERTQPQLLEGLGDIGAPVFGRLEPTGPHEIISVLVPFAVREVVPEHSGGGLCLADDADRHIGFSQPRQRLLDVARGLV